jgi:PAS domain S-box-containing protein
MGTLAQVAGYEALVLVYADADADYYRAVDVHDGAAVVLKTACGDPPERHRIERLRHEHELLLEMQGPGVANPRALLAHEGSLVLVLDAIDEVQRLDMLVRAAGDAMAIGRFFEIALGVTEVLERAHGRRIVHGDLRPHNVLIDRSTGRPQLVGFGGATREGSPSRAAAAPEQRSDRLPYLAPELSGRMNRRADGRADFYALGISFYEMLTGVLPFDAADALELLHSHLARTPMPPRQRRAEIPVPLSDLVLKLMAKLAEDRYQSAAGLASDLRRCQAEWSLARHIEPFVLGSADVALHMRSGGSPASTGAGDAGGAAGAAGPADAHAGGMHDKLNALPNEAREMLALAALLGDTFALDALALAAQRTPGEIEQALHAACEVGLVVRVGTDGRFANTVAHEAALSLTPPPERAERHWLIGCRLLDRLGVVPLEQRRMEVLEHLNLGAAAANAQADAEHRRAAARLNLHAGKGAMAASAHAAAARYFDAGITLLDGGAWEDDYPLAFGLHLGRSQVAWAGSDLAAARASVELLQARAQSDDERVEATLAGMSLYVSLRDLASARDFALAGMRSLGVDVPAMPARADVDAAWRDHVALLAGAPIETLIDLPRMTDAGRLREMRLLRELHLVTFYTDLNLWALVCCRVVMLSQHHGHAPGTAAGCAQLGYMIGLYHGDHRLAFRYGELANEMVRRHEVSADAALVQGFRPLIGAWTLPPATTRELLRESMRRSLAAGDPLSASAAGRRLMLDGLMQGRPLDELEVQADEYMAIAAQSRDALGVDALMVRRQHIRALRGRTHGLLDLGDAAVDGAELEARVLAARSPQMCAALHLGTMIRRCLAGDAAAGHAAACAAEAELARIGQHFSLHDLHAWGALCLATMCDSADATVQANQEAGAGVQGTQRTRLREQLRRHDEQLREWVALSAANFMHSHLLVAAECARLDGQPLEAMSLYERAAAAARDGGYTHFEAQAHERAAAFYRAAGAAAAAQAHIAAARDAYLRWGALAKVRRLDAAFSPHLLGSEAPAARTDVARLDALVVARATHAISQQLRPEDVQRELMTIVLQQAGAQRGALLLVRDETLRLMASARGDGAHIEVTLHGAGGDALEWLARSVVDHVWRSGEQVLIDDARAHHPFAADAALAACGARSVLALPVVRQARVAGVLVLEHAEASGAFTLGNAAILEQLAAQATISLENAQLVAELEEHRRTLEQQVRARTAEVESGRLLLQSILDGSQAQISVRDLDGRFVLHNKEYMRAFGRGRASLVGFRLEEVLDPDFAALVRGLDASLLVDGSGASGAVFESRSDKGRVMQVYRFPLHNLAGEVHAVGSIAIDVTELVRAQQAAESATRSKSEFLANMSHEIRTPMNAILGMAHLALRSGLDERQHNYVAKIQRSAELLLGVINDILDFSKIEAGKLDVERAAFALGDVLDGVHGLTAHKAEEKGLALRLPAPAELPPAPLLGDALRLTQVLVNLVNNGVKFTERGEVELQVHLVRRSAAGVRLRFEVRDSGIGMDEAQQARLFQPFMQADASTTRRYGGTGLGLAISRQLVVLMGGELGVQSRLGAGSTFHFELDFEPAPPAAAPVPAADPEELLQQLRGARVLLVEDNEINQEVALELLRHAGVEVTLAEDGSQALQRLAQQPYDVVLMDCQMPVMDGYEATLAIRAMPQHARLPIIAMTANVFSGDRDKALACGMNDHIAKPLEIDLMYGTIARWLGEGRAAGA